jgi:hypothetical protein
MNHQPSDEPSLAPGMVPRRWVLRVVTGAAVGVVTLVGLAACGGEGGEGDEEEEEDD